MLSPSFLSPHTRLFLSFALLLSSAFIPRALAEEFSIAVGDTIADAQPALGAGRITVPSEIDTYRFTASAGQIVFAESLGADPSLAPVLRWRLTAPNGAALFDRVLASGNAGRTVLAEAGVYTVRVSLSGNNPTATGKYSFQIRSVPPDTTFSLPLNSTVSDNSPAAGAGRIEVPGAEDLYRFQAAQNQIVFFDEMGDSPTLGGALRWRLTSPSGRQIFDHFFRGGGPGRFVLPEAGEYRIRLYVSDSEITRVGTYAFRTLSLPPDGNFPIKVGDAISAGKPSPGAGQIELPGSEDAYTFTGSSNQLVFFEGLGADPALGLALRWRLTTPTAKTVFDQILRNGGPGRQVLPESGTYQLRISVSDVDTNRVGSYAFRTFEIPPDGRFDIRIGDTISDGVPAPGAGRIEIPGSEDFYSFSAAANQVVFFDTLENDPALGISLRWRLISPTEKTVLDTFWGSSGTGRTVLPEAGNYRIRVYAGDANTNRVGKYALQIRGDISDSNIPIAIGATVSNGNPAVGAGNIETPGSEDRYTFSGKSGQRILFQDLGSAATLGAALRWRLTSPTGVIVFDTFFGAFSQPTERTLPETGPYTLRLYVSSPEPSKTGAYSFRFFIPVDAFPDHLQALPEVASFFPIPQLLCNDVFVAEDHPSVALPNGPTTENGGAVILESNTLRYTPKPGFRGLDRFLYKLIGDFGGDDSSVVEIVVSDSAGTFATASGFASRSDGSAIACLLGAPNAAYQIQESPDLAAWSPTVSVNADAHGILRFEILPRPAARQLFFRAKKK